MSHLKSLSFAAAALALVVAAPTFTPDVQAGDKKNIVEIAVSNKDFSNLVALVKQAKLVETLSSKGPFTVFAPVDAAFAQIPEKEIKHTLEGKYDPELKHTLTFHVLPGKIMSADLKGKKTTAKPVGGGELEIDATGSDVTVNGAKVVAADIEASNGVIHVIDKVLLPKEYIGSFND